MQQLRLKDVGARRKLLLDSKEISAEVSKKDNNTVSTIK